MSEIRETCGCGASITAPLVPYDVMNCGQRLAQSGLTEARAVIKDWRENHHCASTAAKTEPAAPPRVHAVPAADTSRAPQWDFDRRQPVRLGFQPNEATS